MLLVVRSFGAVIVLLGAIILARPEALRRVIEFFEKGGRFYLVGALRVALGVILMASAGQFQWSGEILAIGILVLLSGVVTLFLGLDRVRATGEWWKRQPALLTRLWAVLAIGVGLFLLYAPRALPDAGDFREGMTRQELVAEFGRPERTQTLLKSDPRIWGPIEGFWDSVPMDSRVTIWSYPVEGGALELYFVDDSDEVEGIGFFAEGAVYEGGTGATGPASEAGSDKTSDPDTSEETLVWEIRSEERKEGSCDERSDAPSPPGCATVSLLWPEIIAAPTDRVRESLNRRILDTLLSVRWTTDTGESPRSEKSAESIDALVEEFFSSYREVTEEFEDYEHPWWDERTIEIVFFDERVVCFRFSENLASGGAHPNHVVYFSNVDLSNGRRLELADLLVHGYEDRLLPLAEEEFRRVRSVDPEQSLEDAGYWFEDDVFTLSSNFGIVESGLIFFYNNYEVAPYSSGQTELLLTFEKIGHLARTDGPINDLVAAAGDR